MPPKKLRNTDKHGRKYKWVRKPRNPFPRGHHKKNIVNNASLTLSSMDNLEDSLNETYLKVRTVANKFQAIADNQFIENRVQEEEDFVLANDEKDTFENQKSTENSKAQILDCINDCQNVLRKKFETVQLSGIDSEDEMANSSPVVLVPKNAYKERPLPHLIGGEQFNTDETLGLGPTGDSMDDSIESDDDPDETDGSSYYSSIATKETVNQVQSSEPPAKPVAEFIQRDSPKKDHFIPEPPPFMHSNFSFDPPRIEDDLHSCDLFSNTLLPEAPILYEPSDELFSDAVIPANKDPRASNYVKNNGDLLSANKTDKEEARNVSIKSSVSREQLLSGRNFASFKEDLARVLSGGSKPIRKQSISDSDDSKSDISSSPAQGVDGEKKGTFEDSSPKPRPNPSPANRSTALSGSDNLSSSPVSSPSHSGGVTLPSVSTDVLENLAKGRAKVKGKRRPPSRKHRQSNLNEENYSVDQNTNPSDSTHSGDTSVHGSSSTQPGSNILSPATDEEDLFVLPAFDLPSDPPNRGLFFGNSLLSPGTTIDDGGVSNSQLYPIDTHVETSPVISPDITSDASMSSHSVSSKKSPTVEIEKPKPKTKVNTLPTDLFSPNKGHSNDNYKQLNVSKIADEVVVDTDLFSKTSLMNDCLNDKFDIFSSTRNENKFSSSPPLFSDWTQSPDSSKTNNKSTSKSSKQLGLNWGFLGSDDIGEDLFRPQKKESSAVPSMDETSASKFVEDKKDKVNIFSPSPFLSFDRRGGGTLFEDESSYSASDIFAGSSSFMGLSLPKNSGDSLFASDDDEDDDSLFKSSKSSSILKSSENSTEPEGTHEGKNHNIRRNSTRELVNDPLSSMDQQE